MHCQIGLAFFFCGERMEAPHLHGLFFHEKCHERSTGEASKRETPSAKRPCKKNHHDHSMWADKFSRIRQYANHVEIPKLGHDTLCNQTSIEMGNYTQITLKSRSWVHAVLCSSRSWRTRPLSYLPASAARPVWAPKRLARRMMRGWCHLLS